jgi:acyl carrier protein
MDAIKQIIADQLCIVDADVDLHKTFADLGADAVDFWEIVIGVDDHFGIDIPDTAFAGEQDTRIGDFIDQVTVVMGVQA